MENKNDIMSRLPKEIKEEMNLADNSGTEMDPELLRQYRELEAKIKAQAAQAEKASEDKLEVAAHPSLADAAQGTQEISETFAAMANGNLKGVDLTLPDEPQEEKKPEPKPIRPYSPLDGLTVDLNNIELVDKSPFQQRDDFEVVFNRKAVYEIVCAQSGYSARMSALALADINSITNSNVDLYTHKKRLYEAIHSHLEDTSVGKIGLKDWLRVTSFHDLETLMYGIYCQTFPEKNEFDVTCGSCQKKTSLVVNNVTLVESKDADIYGRMSEIMYGVKKPEELVKTSLVHTKERIMLPQSKIVFDVYTPSLWDHLELLANTDPRFLEKHQDTVGTLLFVKAMYFPDVARIKATGRPAYYPIQDRNQQLDIITKLGLEDGKELSKAINGRVNKYGITYSVKNAKCQHCSDSLGELPIDIETALFTLIQRQNQG